MKLHSASILVLLLAIASFSDQRCDAAQDGTRTRKQNKPSKKSGKKGKKSAERVITMWWVLFNKPSECTANPDGDVKECGIKDVMMVGQGGVNKAEIVIMNASGGISDMNGHLRMTSALYKTCTRDLDLEGSIAGADDHYIWGGPSKLYNQTLGSRGYCPVNDEETEVHIVLRDHGPMTENKLWQLTRFTDPSCSQNDGPNLCVDNGAVGFPSMNGDGMMTKDIGHFPMFPPGCAASGECDTDSEAVQLSTGMDNEVTIIKVGDVLQVVTEVTAPMV